MCLVRLSIQGILERLQALLAATTVQKLILNMLTTASMIRMGKVYKNLMVDLKPVNHKLVLRSIRMIQQVTGCTEEEAREGFDASGKRPKTAIVMVLLKKDRDEAERMLK